MALDFLYDNDNDLLILNGDLVTGFSDGDHIRDIIEFCQGELKQFPLCGVGINTYNQAPNVVQNINRVINSQFEADNAIIKYLAVSFDKIDNAKVDIDANY